MSRKSVTPNPLIIWKELERSRRQTLSQLSSGCAKALGVRSSADPGVGGPYARRVAHWSPLSVRLRATGFATGLPAI